MANGSIAENLRLAVPNASLGALHRAAELAGAADFIERLPQGYETIIGEHGQGLFGGQIRRLTLARAALKPADLVILDEADASLDNEAAVQVAEAMRVLARDRAVLFIAHRLESVACADRIVVIEEGHIRECGTPTALLANGGAYTHVMVLEAKPYNFLHVNFLMARSIPNARKFSGLAGIGEMRRRLSPAHSPHRDVSAPHLHRGRLRIALRSARQ